MLTHRVNDRELTAQDRRRQRLHNLFSILSNKDSLRVFELASQRVIASNSTLEKIKLSKAQYYRKIKQLTELGLVMRGEEGVYRHTPLGEIVYNNHVVTLSRIAADNNIMDVVAKFILKNKSSNESIESAVRQITQELIGKNNAGLWNLGRLRLLETIQEYDSNVVGCVSSAKTELCLATRSLDLGTVEAVLRSAERGTKINMIYTDWRGFYSESALDPLDDLLLAASKKHPAAAQLLRSEPIVSIKRTKIPYSFVVSDGLRVAVEIADPVDPKSFFFGVGLESKELATKLVSYHGKLRDSVMKKVVL